MPGPLQLALLVGLLLPLLVVVRFFRRSGATLVLQKFSLKQDPQPFGTPIVEIVGRSQGLIAFVLTTMGFSANTKLTVTNSEVRCESASLFGQRFQFIPLRCVGTLGAGLHKPITTLLAAGALLLFGGYCWIFQQSGTAFAIATTIAAALVVLYFFSKKFFIEVYPNGGPVISLLFKPSAIEGVPIDVNQALAVIAVMRDVITSDGSGSVTVQRASSPPPLSRPTVAAPVPQPHPTPNGPLHAVPAADTESEARVAFAHAKQLFDSGQKTQAIQALERLVRDYPNTVAARNAEKSLQRVSTHDN